MKLFEIAPAASGVLTEGKKRKRKKKAKKSNRTSNGFRTPVAYAGGWGWGIVAPGDNSGEGGDGGGD